MVTLLREAFFFSRHHLQPLLLIALVYTLPSLVVELLFQGDKQALPEAMQLLLSGLFVCLGVVQFGAAMLYIHGRVQGAPISVGNAIGGAIRQLMPLLLINLLMGIAIAGGLLLLVLPGLYLAYKLLFAEFMLLFHQRSPIAALKESYRVTEGCATEILPPLGIWITAVILLAMARMALFGDTGTADSIGLIVQEGLSMLLSIYGWALLYRLYQRYIADQIDAPARISQDERPPEE